MCKPKANNCKIKYLCKDLDGDCVYFEPKDNSFPIVCKWLNKNMECDSKMCTLNKLTLDYKRYVVGLNASD